MKWESNRVKKAKYLKIGPVDLRSIGLIFFCLAAVWVGLNACILRQLLLSTLTYEDSQVVDMFAIPSLSTGSHRNDICAYYRL